MFSGRYIQTKHGGAEVKEAVALFSVLPSNPPEQIIYGSLSKYQIHTVTCDLWGCQSTEILNPSVNPWERGAYLREIGQHHDAALSNDSPPNRLATIPDFKYSWPYGYVR